MRRKSPCGLGVSCWEADRCGAMEMEQGGRCFPALAVSCEFSQEKCSSLLLNQAPWYKPLQTRGKVRGTTRLQVMGQHIATAQ